MKRFGTILLYIILSITWVLCAQVHNVLNYQGVLKNPDGTTRPNSEAILAIEFLQDGLVVYSENHQITTNNNGFFTINPGAGNAIYGSFADIDWSNANVTMQSILDGEVIAITKLTAVPYALYAHQVAGFDKLTNSIDSLSNTMYQTAIQLDDIVISIDTLGHEIENTTHAIYNKISSIGADVDSIIMLVANNSLDIDTLHNRIMALAVADSIATSRIDTLANRIASVDTKTDSLSQENNFFNATAHSSLPQGSFHTLQSAIEATPQHLRKSGIIVTFKSDSNNWRSVQYTLSDTTQWNNERAWSNYGYYGNLTIPYTENDSITRLLIPDYIRRQGLIISYYKDNRIVNEQYKMPQTDNQTWCNANSWISLYGSGEEFAKMHEAIANIDKTVNEVKKGMQDMSTFGAWFYIDSNDKFTQAGAIDKNGNCVQDLDMVHTLLIPIDNQWFVTTYGNATYPGIIFYDDNGNMISASEVISDENWQQQTIDFSTDQLPQGARYFSVNMALEKQSSTYIKYRNPITNVIDTSTDYTYKTSDYTFNYVGAYVGLSGKRNINTQYRHSRFIEIADNDYKIITHGTYKNDTIVPLVVYYSSESFNTALGYDLGEVQSDRSTTREVYISAQKAPQGAKYFVVNCHPSAGAGQILTGRTVNDVINLTDDRLAQLENNQSCYTGRKMVTLGDSFTTNSGNRGKSWQQWLVDWLGVEWSEDETKTGTNGFDAMGYGGSWILPNDINSMAIRCIDVRRYSPNVIILYGGQNDKLERYPLGSIDDTPFEVSQIIDLTARSYITSKEEALAYMQDKAVKKNNTIVHINVSNWGKQMYFLADTAHWDNPEAWVPPIETTTFYGTYKGIVERLCKENPYATIYCMTLMQCDSTKYDKTLGEWEALDQMRRQKNEAIKEIAQYYGAQVIDLWNQSGVTPYNAASLYNDWLHPNQYGYRRLAECVYRYLK